MQAIYKWAVDHITTNHHYIGLHLKRIWGAFQFSFPLHAWLNIVVWGGEGWWETGGYKLHDIYATLQGKSKYLDTLTLVKRRRILTTSHTEMKTVERIMGRDCGEGNLSRKALKGVPLCEEAWQNRLFWHSKRNDCIQHMFPSKCHIIAFNIARPFHLRVI